MSEPGLHWADKDKPVVVSDGARMVLVPGERPMKYYPVMKLELDQIATLNKLSTIFYSLTTMVVPLLIGFIWDRVIGGPLKTGADLASWVFIGVAAVAAAVFLALAIYFQWVKSTRINEIVNSTRERVIPDPR